MRLNLKVFNVSEIRISADNEFQNLMTEKLIVRLSMTTNIIWIMRRWTIMTKHVIQIARQFTIQLLQGFALLSGVNPQS